MLSSVQNAIERVVEAMQWFVVAKEVRTLHVVTGDALRKPVLSHIAAAEWDPENEAAYFVLEVSDEEGAVDWELRADELRVEWDTMREELARGDDPIVVADLWPAVSAPGMERFARELAMALRHLPSPMRGLVVVLAPIEVTDRRRWQADLRTLVGLRGLDGVRWAVVDVAEPFSLEPLRQLGVGVEHADARIAEADRRADLDSIVAAVASTPPDATGFRLTGAAGPNERAPARKGKPPPPTKEALKQLLASKGLPEGLAETDQLRELNLSLLRAAQALADGRTGEAMALYRRAADAATAAGLRREAHLILVGASGIAMQAGEADVALRALANLRVSAEQIGSPDVAAMAELARGAALLAKRRATDAAMAFAEAGRLAEPSMPILAIEAFRTCGQVCMTAGMTDQAIHALGRALAVAQVAPPADRKLSSAAAAARQLAAIYRSARLHDRADSLERQAAELDAQRAAPSADVEPVHGAAAE